MRHTPLQLALILHVVPLAAAAVAAVAILEARAADRVLEREAAEELLRHARLLRPAVHEAVASGRLASGMLGAAAAGAGLRLTVIAFEGTPLWDSEADATSMENHADRPEVAEALSGREAWIARPSPTVGEILLYAAVPLSPDGKPSGVLRVSRPLVIARRPRWEVWRRSLATALAVIVASSLALWRAARGITAPIERVASSAASLAAGKVEDRIRVDGPAEVVSLADTINRMADGLRERLATVIRQSALLEAILHAIPDGVLALDARGRIVDLNDAAARELGLQREQALGRPAAEAIRCRELLEFVRRAQAASGPVEDTLTVYGDPERVLEVRACQLRGPESKDASEKGAGILAVLRDVTQLRRLESLRSEFVANVSHELKTPITTIKGFVETLLTGALQDPDTAQRFLRIVAREVDRLAAIVEDLMDLARLERQGARRDLKIVEMPVRPVLQAAVDACTETSRMRGVQIALDCPGDLRAQVNDVLLERAVWNLLDNAIKYSPPESEITVRAARDEQGLAISVQDRGCGIAPEHLPRIFERFYRVDRARSRAQGGTGLGLAIVKHVAQALGGNVSVVSRVGEGSIFTIRLP